MGNLYRGMAEAAGVSTTGKQYMHGLAEFPGDPGAWVDGTSDVLRVAKERGFRVHGAVDDTPPPSAPAPDVPVAPEIIEEQVEDSIGDDDLGLFLLAHNILLRAVGNHSHNFLGRAWTYRRHVLVTTDLEDGHTFADAFGRAVLNASKARPAGAIVVCTRNHLPSRPPWRWPGSSASSSSPSTTSSPTSTPSPTCERE